MDKNQNRPTKEDLERARAEVDEIKAHGMREWVRDQAKLEISEARLRAKIAEYKKTHPRASEQTARASVPDISFFYGTEIDERVHADYAGLAERAIERVVRERAAGYAPARERAAEAAESRAATDRCPVCGEVSGWGHRLRTLTDSGDSASSNIDSCLPCFLTAQQMWLEIENQRVPQRTAAVRAKVTEISGARN